jgi:outer membrane lipoprotein
MRGWIRVFCLPIERRGPAFEGVMAGVRRILAVAVAAGLFCGCGHVISGDVLKEAEKKVTFGELRKDPDAFKGRVLVVGGFILQVLPQKEGTLLEIYQTPLDRQGMPLGPETTGGRFLVMSQEVLDSNVYRRGARVTVGGTVKGGRAGKVEKTDYLYPYLTVKDIHVWEKARPRNNDPYRWGPRGPWWWNPWYDQR